jgi:hypothetical protein
VSMTPLKPHVLDLICQDNGDLFCTVGDLFNDTAGHCIIDVTKLKEDAISR